MHPELLSSLTAEHQRDLAATAGRRGLSRHGLPRHGPSLGARLRAAYAGAPQLRVTWSRTSLPAAASGRRGRSVLIVISATRGL